MTIPDFTHVPICSIFVEKSVDFHRSITIVAAIITKGWNTEPPPHHWKVFCWDVGSCFPYTILYYRRFTKIIAAEVQDLSLQYIAIHISSMSHMWPKCMLAPSPQYLL